MVSIVIVVVNIIVAVVTMVTIVVTVVTMVTIVVTVVTMVTIVVAVVTMVTVIVAVVRKAVVSSGNTVVSGSSCSSSNMFSNVVYLFLAVFIGVRSFVAIFSGIK